MLARGWSDLRIGSLIGRSPVAVQTQRFRLGIEHVLPNKQKAEGCWRSCMCCQRKFWSEGNHNTICYPCKRTKAYWMAS